VSRLYPYKYTDRILFANMRGLEVSREQKDEAVELYESGECKSYDEVSAATGISKGSLSGIFAAEAKADPDFVGTHELARYARENNLSVKALGNGARLYAMLSDLKISPEQLETVVIPFIMKAGANPIGRCKEATEYLKLIKSTGMTHEQLVREQIEGKKKLESISKEKEEGLKEVQTLENKIHNLKSELSDLQDLKEIKKQLDHIGKNLRDAAKLLKVAEESVRRGLSIEVMQAISTELATQNMQPGPAGRRIVQLVNHYGSLEKGISFLQTRTAALDRLISKQERKRLHLVDTLESLEKEVENTIPALSRLSNEFTDLQGKYERRERLLDERFAEEEAAWKRKITELKETRDALIKSVGMLERTQRSLGGNIDAAKVLWNFVVKGKAASLNAFFPLGQMTTYYNPLLPLSESVHQVFKDALRDLAMDDVLQRIEREEILYEEQRTEHQRKIYQRWVVAQELETKTNYLLKLQSGLTSVERASREFVKELISQPSLVSVVFSQPREVLVEGFAKLSYNERSRIRSLISDADRCAERMENRRFEAWINAQMNRALLESFAPPSFLPAQARLVFLGDY
jgi:hypothetical protein